MSGFQTQVNYTLAPGVAGDFCTTNPRASVISGPGSIVCGAAGVTVGRFAWLSYSQVDADEAPAVANNFGSGPVTGFVHREQQGLIPNYLQEFSMSVPAGFPITLFSEGDFWMKNDGSSYAQVGMKVYANYADGKATAALTGAPTNATATGVVAAATSSSTGSIADNILTVTAVSSGSLYNGTTISGTNVATGTKIVSQLTPLLSGETLLGVGRYTVSIPEQTVASTTISGTYGLLTLSSTITGVWGVGQTVTGTGITATTTITALGTGAGAAGTYIVDVNTVVSSTAVTGAMNVETAWYVRSGAAAGELFKASKWPQG